MNEWDVFCFLVSSTHDIAWKAQIFIWTLISSLLPFSSYLSSTDATLISPFTEMPYTILDKGITDIDPTKFCLWSETIIGLVIWGDENFICLLLFPDSILCSLSSSFKIHSFCFHEGGTWSGKWEFISSIVFEHKNVPTPYIIQMFPSAPLCKFCEHFCSSVQVYACVCFGCQEVFLFPRSLALSKEMMCLAYFTNTINMHPHHSISYDAILISPFTDM